MCTGGDYFITSCGIGCVNHLCTRRPRWKLCYRVNRRRWKIVFQPHLTFPAPFCVQFGMYHEWISTRGHPCPMSSQVHLVNVWSHENVGCCVIPSIILENSGPLSLRRNFKMLGARTGAYATFRSLDHAGSCTVQGTRRFPRLRSISTFFFSKGQASASTCLWSVVNMVRVE